MSLSAVIITKNEARNIERCLNSLLGVVDEIIVVDSMSTDATVDICRRYGCRVTSRAFTGYGSQRQYAAGLARTPYVLSIDADEALSEELRQSIIKLKNEGFTHRMYCFRVVNYICGHTINHSGMAPKIETRLFDRRFASWNLNDVGERLTYPGGVRPHPIEGDMYHHRCDDFGELDFKEIRNARLRGRLMAAAGINASRPACWLRAMSAYIGCHLRDGAIFDGATGRRIALTRFKATYEAYKTASNIVRGKE